MELQFQGKAHRLGKPRGLQRRHHVVTEIEKTPRQRLAQTMTATGNTPRRWAHMESTAGGRRRNMVACVGVSEVYARERERDVPVACEAGMERGSSSDLATRDRDGRLWDLSRPEMRRRAVNRISEEDPRLPVGSVMCRDALAIVNITWQRLSAAAKQRRLEHARRRLEHVRSLYELQHRRGYCIHGQHHAATSWRDHVFERRGRTRRLSS